MKREVTETLACTGEVSDDSVSVEKRMRHSCLTDRLYFNKIFDLDTELPTPLKRVSRKEKEKRNIVIRSWRMEQEVRREGVREALGRRLWESAEPVIGLKEEYNVNAFSLAELIELISPLASIHFNFMVDLPWLLEQYPGRLRQGPITLIVGERMGTDFAVTKTAIKRLKVDNVNVGRARLMIPFGTHHSKISIFESSNGRVHIIIGTANLVENDWIFKTQAFYHCSGIELAAGSSFSGNESDFQAALIKYLNEYKTSQDWDLIQHWRDRIANIDLSHVKARVVYSVPGTHKGVQLTKYGHPRLRVILKELFGDVKRSDFTYHAQFSSFGSLGAAPQYWLTGQFLNSLSGGAETDGEHLRIIYPCVEDVRNSNEGYQGGGSLPYTNSVATKQPYLLSFLHKWRSDHLGRSHAMPHVKTYAAFAKNSIKPSWLLVTSANLSKVRFFHFYLLSYFHLKRETAANEIKI
uniref:PLD phosphodiesterase domain-containing protein n=1 Tax=Elaeophora elaphi TaxID=1147741 RepID=A0A0R3RW94_9BILA